MGEIPCSQSPKIVQAPPNMVLTPHNLYMDIAQRYDDDLYSVQP